MKKNYSPLDNKYTFCRLLQYKIKYIIYVSNMTAWPFKPLHSFHFIHMYTKYPWSKFWSIMENTWKTLNKTSFHSSVSILYVSIHFLPDFYFRVARMCLLQNNKNIFTLHVKMLSISWGRICDCYHELLLSCIEGVVYHAVNKLINMF